MHQLPSGCCAYAYKYIPAVLLRSRVGNKFLPDFGRESRLLCKILLLYEKGAAYPTLPNRIFIFGIYLGRVRSKLFSRQRLVAPGTSGRRRDMLPGCLRYQPLLLRYADPARIRRIAMELRHFYDVPRMLVFPSLFPRNQSQQRFRKWSNRNNSSSTTAEYVVTFPNQQQRHLPQAGCRVGYQARRS